MAICLKMKSDYSFLSSTISFKDAINFAKKNHQTHLSLIVDNLHGAFEFYNLCIENKIQPIIGIEIQVMFQNQLQPLVLIAKNEIGFKNISKLSYLTKRVNKSYMDMEWDKNQTTYSRSDSYRDSFNRAVTHSVYKTITLISGENDKRRSPVLDAAK